MKNRFTNFRRNQDLKDKRVAKVDIQRKSFLTISKRQKIVISSLILWFAFLITTQTVNIVFKRYYFILGLACLSYILSLWSLWEGMTKLKAVILLILPVFYSVSVGGFYFIFQETNIRWLTRLPLSLFFAASFYVLLLSQNVFNVASVRTIPLYRAASSASFVFTILTLLLLYSVIYTFNLPFYWNGLTVFFASLLLFFQILWTVEMEGVSGHLIAYSLILSLMVAEIAIALSFWAVSPPVWALFLGSFVYITLGIIHEYLRDRLSRAVVWEYTGVGIFLSVLVLFVTSINY